jgi:multidrug efflux pump
MVLAIGLLVDDAIVVVENVERVMEEDPTLSPRQATRRSMQQITGALVGIALVLSAVFLPMAFISGSTGVIYRQFSVTIVSAMVLSVATALVLTPALCATLLRRPKPGGKRGFFAWFNRNFDRGAGAYARGVGGLVRRPAIFMAGFLLIIVIMGVVFLRIPGGFLPDEDQGVMFVQINTPPGATANRTQQVLDEVSNYMQHDEGAIVADVMAVNGFGFAGHGQSSGLCFVQLKDWSLRHGARDTVFALARRAMQRFAAIKDAQVFPFVPPPVLELGNATGFDFELLDRANLGHAALLAARNQLLGMAAADPLLIGVRPNGLNDEPQYKLVIDQEKASALGITLADINAQLGAAWGSAYVNDFIDQGRVKRVYIQGQAAARMLPEDFSKWYIRNGAATSAGLGAGLGSQQQMVPFSAFAHGEWIMGSPKLERYNGTSSVEILGMPAPGLSTGSAMAEMAKLAARLPPGFGYDWTGLSYEEQQSGSQTTLLYTLSMVVVFLCLAALYESWAIPAAVILVIPLGIVGVVLATFLRGMDNDVYFQVGLLTTMGLASKNAILIVEFAKENYESGMSLIDAAVHAARQRLRPILMTSLAFILGVLPLAVSTGAGSGSQNAIGTAVAGGMLSATVLAIFLVPLFFVLVLGLFRVKPHQAAEEEVA